jgi:CRISPR-associated protein Cmr3
MSQFSTLIAVSPLGFLYGSAGGFLSPENLVGRSNTKFPPDAATIAGLIFNVNREQSNVDHQTLKENLIVAGPFWAHRETPAEFYVPIPWHRVVDQKDTDEWELVHKNHQESSSQGTADDAWLLNQQQWQRHNKEVKPAYFWQSIDAWDVSLDELRDRRATSKAPWEPSPFLHPKIKPDERHVVERDGLFLENAIQLHPDYCLIYLTNLDRPINDGWYRFGGEGHLVDIECQELSAKHKINRLLGRKIHHAFALITPGVWGSNQYSYRYPRHRSFPKKDLKMLTDKPIPYRYRIGQSKSGENSKAVAGDRYNSSATGRLSRGRYAVPPGSVYVFRDPLEMTWWDFPDEWFPKEGFPLKHLGCGLCLPIDIQGVPKCTEKLTA